MSNQLVYKGHYFYGSNPVHEAVTKIYTKKGLALNNCPSGSGTQVNHIVEYELVPTGRKFNMKGVEIE